MKEKVRFPRLCGHSGYCVGLPKTDDHSGRNLSTRPGDAASWQMDRLRIAAIGEIAGKPIRQGG